MPIIRGVKMACEPCIRGHRSTKCNHADERLMVSVRKPGRPLSVCPHPPDHACSCGNVTAAIPRARKCGCGSKSSAKAAKSSPTRRAHHSPTNPTLSTTRTRFDPRAFERTDPSQVNIHPATTLWNGPSTPATGGMQMSEGLNGNSFMLPPGAVSYPTQQGDPSAVFMQAAGPFQNGFQPPVQASSMYGVQTNGFNPYYSPALDMSLSLGQVPQPTDSLGNLSLGMGQPVNGADMSSFDSLPLQEARVDAPKRSCCSGKPPQTPAQSPGHTPNSSLNSLTSNIGTANSVHFSASTPMSSSYSSQHLMLKSESTDGSLQSLPLNSVPLVQAGMKANGIDSHQPDSSFSLAQAADSVSGPMMLPSDPMYSGFTNSNGTPVWYKYNPGYGTMTAPLQPSQWPAGLSVAANPASIEGHLQFREPPLPTSTHPVAAEETGAESHMCACGDDCECIGCVAHPYNSATQNTVQAAWSTMTMDEATSGRRSTKQATVAPGTIVLPVLGSAAQQQPSTDGSSPQQHTPSDTSGMGEDQVSLSADDYFFVSYSVMGCSGEGLTCPCGEDCECVGCTIHNNTESGRQ